MNRRPIITSFAQKLDLQETGILVMLLQDCVICQRQFLPPNKRQQQNRSIIKSHTRRPHTHTRKISWRDPGAALNPIRARLRPPGQNKNPTAQIVGNQAILQDRSYPPPPPPKKKNPGSGSATCTPPTSGMERDKYKILESCGRDLHFPGIPYPHPRMILEGC